MCPKVTIDPATLRTKPKTPVRAKGQPAFVCAFCEHINNYVKPHKYWEHLAQAHVESNDVKVVAEVRRSATA